MPTEKSTNPSWIQQLDELVPPAGSSFDKTGAWEKLQVKLKGIQPSKKVVWVWRAAATVIVLFGIYLLLNNNSILKSTPITHVKKNNREIPSLSIKKEKIVFLPEKTLPVAVIKNNQPYLKKEKTNTVLEKRKTNDIKQPELLGPELVTILQQENIIDTNSGKKTNTNAVQLVFNKKKLAVVHINELTRQDLIETLPAGNGNSTAGIIPDFRKVVSENTIKGENIIEPPVKYKKRLLPFGVSNKPKD